MLGCSFGESLLGRFRNSITDAEDQFQDFLAEKQSLIFVLNCENWNEKIALLLSDGKMHCLVTLIPFGAVLNVKN